MALKQNEKIKIEYVNKNNFTDIKTEEKEYTDIYIQIVSLNGNKEFIELKVNFYKDDTKTEILKREEYSFKPSIEKKSENFIKQGYEYLKTLEEFANAEDC